MGISTYQSYCGAQIFDAVGLVQTSSTSISPAPPPRIGGVGLAEIAEETVMRHATPSATIRCSRSARVGGEYAFRFRGEAHAWTPRPWRLQHAVRGNSQDKYREFAKAINEQRRSC
jgi:glutamate synthase (NADPH/NADH) large chain